MLLHPQILIAPLLDLKPSNEIQLFFCCRILLQIKDVFLTFKPVDLLCSVPDSPEADYTVTSKWPAVWVKITSSWVCLALYIWTLVAPMILTNRDFS